MITSSGLFGSERPAVVFSLHNSLSNNRVVYSSGKICIDRDCSTIVELYLYSIATSSENTDGVWLVRIDMISSYLNG